MVRWLTLHAGAIADGSLGLALYAAILSTWQLIQRRRS